MIGSHTDSAIQRKAIENYMALPNRVWDAIIEEAAKVSHVTSSRTEPKTCK